MIEYREVGHLIQVIVEDNGAGRNLTKTVGKSFEKQHVSISTTVVTERIELMNTELKCNASLSYQDLINSIGEPCGTRVILTIPFKERENS